MADKRYYDLRDENSDLFRRVNEKAREALWEKESIDGISKALTHYVFRNGPVEDMHADGKLSQDDMMTLNKFMVNRIASILECVSQGEWLKLQLLYEFYRCFGGSWDAAEPDMTELDTLLPELWETLGIDEEKE